MAGGEGGGLASKGIWLMDASLRPRTCKDAVHTRAATTQYLTLRKSAKPVRVLGFAKGIVRVQSSAIRCAGMGDLGEEHMPATLAAHHLFRATIVAVTLSLRGLTFLSPRGVTETRVMEGTVAKIHWQTDEDRMGYSR